MHENIMLKITFQKFKW